MASRAAIVGFENITAPEAVIGIPTPGLEVTLVALTDPSVTGSVLFRVNGTFRRIENVVPYALAGDRSTKSKITK